MTNYIKWLENWYKDNCYDEWEHSYGVRIGTLDNPGWSVEVDLEYTNMEDKEFPELEVDNSDDDWIDCFVRNNQFMGYGDPGKLEEIIKVFKEWVESFEKNSELKDIVRNKIVPNIDADKKHVMFIKDHDTGKILNYKVYNPNPENPCGFDEKIRYDAVGVSFNKVTAEIIKSPHVHDSNATGGVREADPDEIPG